MFEDILTKTYYENTISEWGVSLLFIVGTVVIGKIAYWISSNTLRRLVANARRSEERTWTSVSATGWSCRLHGPGQRRQRGRR